MSAIRHIMLTRTMFTVVDAEDFEALAKLPWYALSMNGGQRFCAARTEQSGGRRRTVLMHRVIVNAPQNAFVDHANGNPLDNRRCNLRICTPAQNLQNARPRGGASRFKGVHWHNQNGVWRTCIKVNGRALHLGCFHDEVEAAQAYDDAALKHFGEFARTNFPTGKS